MKLTTTARETVVEVGVDGKVERHTFPKLEDALSSIPELALRGRVIGVEVQPLPEVKVESDPDGRVRLVCPHCGARSSKKVVFSWCEDGILYWGVHPRNDGSLIGPNECDTTDGENGRLFCVVCSKESAYHGNIDWISWSDLDAEVEALGGE